MTLNYLVHIYAKKVITSQVPYIRKNEKNPYYSPTFDWVHLSPRNPVPPARQVLATDGLESIVAPTEKVGYIHSIRPTFYPVHGLSPSVPYFSWTRVHESRSQIVLFETYFSSRDTCDYYLKPTFHVRCTDILRTIDDINSLNYILKILRTRVISRMMSYLSLRPWRDLDVTTSVELERGYRIAPRQVKPKEERKKLSLQTRLWLLGLLRKWTPLR